MTISSVSIDDLVVLDEDHDRPERLGLRLAEAKALLLAVQRQVLNYQVAAFLAAHTPCPTCGRQSGAECCSARGARTKGKHQRDSLVQGQGFAILPCHLERPSIRPRAGGCHGQVIPRAVGSLPGDDKSLTPGLRRPQETGGSRRFGARHEAHESLETGHESPAVTALAGKLQCGYQAAPGSLVFTSRQRYLAQIRQYDSLAVR
jgi:hypothetical protein